MAKSQTLILCLIVLWVGCASTEKTKVAPLPTTPTSKTTVEEVEQLLQDASHSNAALLSPFELRLGKEYFRAALDLKSKGNEAGANRLLLRAKEMAQDALRKSSVKGEASPVQRYSSDEPLDTQLAEFRVKALSVDRNKAIQVAPYIYASLLVSLDCAEEEFKNKKFDNATKYFQESLAYYVAIQSQDSDGDGIPDLLDGSPWQPEDFDGFEDDDGIPDLDNDQDGIPDTIDGAPNTPETFNRWRDEDGVPDEYPALESLPFQKNDATLSAENRAYLRALAIILQEWRALRLRISGYATSLDTGDRLSLARERAFAVRDYLESLGIDKTQLEVVFFEEILKHEPLVQLQFQ